MNLHYRRNGHLLEKAFTLDSEDLINSNPRLSIEFEPNEEVPFTCSDPWGLALISMTTDCLRLPCPSFPLY